MVHTKTSRLLLNDYGSYLGVEKGCFTVKDRHGNVERYPLFEKEIGEVVLKSGNAVSTGALASLGFWDIDVLVLTRKGRPVAMLKSLDDDSHVKTRIAQYEACRNDKAFRIAKQFVLGRIEGQNRVLRKHDLEPHDPALKRVVEKAKPMNMKAFRQRLTGIEGKCSQDYFQRIFKLFPSGFRPQSRKKFQAYDGLNNIFNLAYEVLSWRVHRALTKAKLEPFLGFLHATKFERPSLVCDFVELYRFLIEDFLVHQCREYNTKDFIFKTEIVKGKRMAKRQYLNSAKTQELMNKVNQLFEKKVEIPRIYLGKKQIIGTLINEETLLFARYLRDESESWNPRIAIP